MLALTLAILYIQKYSLPQLLATQCNTHMKRLYVPYFIIILFSLPFLPRQQFVRTVYYVSSHPAPKPGSVFDLQSLARDKHKTGFPFLHYFTHLTSHCEVQPILYISFLIFPPSLRCFKSPWMEPGLRCTIFPATVAVVLGPVQPHYFWEPNSHGPRNRRASSAFLALFPGIVSFVTSRAAFQPVNVCAGRSKFPVFSFRKGNLKFRMQPLFFFFLRKLCFFLFYFFHFCSLL